MSRKEKNAEAPIRISDDQMEDLRAALHQAGYAGHTAADRWQDMHRVVRALNSETSRSFTRSAHIPSGETPSITDERLRKVAGQLSGWATSNFSATLAIIRSLSPHRDGVGRAVTTLQGKRHVQRNTLLSYGTSESATV
jgi:hypothetical protein